MAQETRIAVEQALADARQMILSLGIHDIDNQSRSDAESAVLAALHRLQAGFRMRAHELAREESARIYQLYLDGQLVEKRKP